MTRNAQLAALFNQDDIVALKQDLTSLPSYEPSGQQFFCINPLKQPGKLVTENIAQYRNILIEMDSGTLEEQWLKIETSLLPWTTCTYSGGKSLHFIICIEEGVDDLRYYNNLARIISEALGADTSTTNPNRLSRLAGAYREGGAEQELVEVRARTSLKKLLDWMYSVAPKELRTNMAKIQERIMKEQLAALIKQDEPPEDAKTILPNIYKAMLEEGALHPNCTSRHQSLLKFAVWLKENWHAQDEVVALLEQAETSLGLSGRGDLRGILKYVGF